MRLRMSVRALSTAGLVAFCLIWTVPTLAAEGAAQKCEALKLKAAGKNAACQTRQLAKMVAGGTADLDACSAKLAAAFAKLEAKGGCATTGDATAIASQLNTAANGILTNLGGSCAPKTCGDSGGSCGIVSDDCGGTLDCGPCENTCSSDADCINTRACRSISLNPRDHRKFCEPKLTDSRSCLLQNDCLSLCCCDQGNPDFNVLWFTDAEGNNSWFQTGGFCAEPGDCSVSGNAQCPGALGPPRCIWDRVSSGCGS